MAKAKPKRTFKEVLAAAKELDMQSFGVEVPVDEIEEGRTIMCYPLSAKDRGTKLMELWGHKDEVVQQWALVICCFKDDDGEPEFTVDDVKFMEENLGFAFRLKLQTAASTMSGLNEEFKVLKKKN